MPKKTNKLLVGLVLLVIGGLLIYWGYNEAESVRGQFSSVFSGSPTNRVLMFYAAGAVCGLAGLFMAFKK
jgi:hypothetical protein